MYVSVISGAFRGMDSFLVQVEVDVSNGLPCMEMIGYLASEVKETKERVRVGIKNSGYEMPVKRITISLSPADVKKDGSGFDLPVAIGILSAIQNSENNDNKELNENELNNAQNENNRMTETIVLGEIGLDGAVKPIKGILPILLKASEEKITSCIIPYDNRYEAANVKDMDIYPVSMIQEAFEIYRMLNSVCYVKENGKKKGMEGILASKQFNKTGDMLMVGAKDIEKQNETLDFNQVQGQHMAKRAAEIAAAGFHNLLLFGSPGTGKSMIAKRIGTILPEMTYEECLEVTKIYSVAGLLDTSTSLITKRPFVDPHHTATASALIGGGTIPKPGMITLANKGILFLDELPEFGRVKLDLLRQPLEERKVRISRNVYSCVYQADFMLVAAMNPCPCGFYPNRHKCNCKEHEIARYLSQLSGPLLDRIDISVEVGAMKWEEIEKSMHAGQMNNTEESSAVIRQRVMRAHVIQLDRNKKFNANLTNEELAEKCLLNKAAEDILKKCFERYGLSIRSVNRIKKVARTIADLDASELIEANHISEAIMLNKGLERVQKKGSES